MPADIWKIGLNQNCLPCIDIYVNDDDWMKKITFQSVGQGQSFSIHEKLSFYIKQFGNPGRIRGGIGFLEFKVSML